MSKLDLDSLRFASCLPPENNARKPRFWRQHRIISTWGADSAPKHSKPCPNTLQWQNWWRGAVSAHADTNLHLLNKQLELALTSYQFQHNTESRSRYQCPLTKIWIICKQKYDFISLFGNHSNNKCQHLCAFVCVCIALTLQCVRSCGTEREAGGQRERWVDPACSPQPYLREMNRLIMACRRLQRVLSQDMDASHLACGRFWGCYHSSNKLGFQGNSK